MQDEAVARVDGQTQQLAALGKFPGQLAGTELDLRSQAIAPRATFSARFSQAMSQLDASAAVIARAYPETSAVRAQFSSAFAELRSRYDAAHRAIAEDLAGQRRSDYLVVYADPISQASQALIAVTGRMLDDDKQIAPLQARSLAAISGRIAEIWLLAGLAILAIMCAFVALLVRGATQTARIVQTLQASAPSAATGAAATRETPVVRAPVKGEDLPKMIDLAIPVALENELKTGVLFLAISGLDHLRADHSAEEIEALQTGVCESISAALRPSDMVARLGNGEFGILLAEMRQRGDFVPIQQRIRRAVTFAQMRFPQFAGKDIALRINAAMYPIDGYSGEELLRSARMNGPSAKTGLRREPAADAAKSASEATPALEPAVLEATAPQEPASAVAAVVFPQPVVSPPIARPRRVPAIAEREDAIFT